MRNKKIGHLLILFVFILSVSSPAMAQSQAADLAPLIAVESAQAIPGHYIVVFKEASGVQSSVESVAQSVTQAGGTVQFVYSSALQGFSASLSASLLESLRRNSNIAYIEADQVVTLDASQSPATWGLDRIDQRNRQLNNTYNYNFTGAGVDVYVIDTGIRTTHTEFGGRADKLFDSVGDGQNGNDCHGHGTHVSGTIGGATYGVAKGVALHAVRVLNCQGSGTISGVVAGVDFVTSHHVNNSAVANMSLGGGASQALDNAVINSINDGVTYSIAAGNSNANACNYSPARVAAAITVGATTSADKKASYSNYGSCLDLFAPGTSITSAWNSSDTATNTISGTSMAAPHVAGVAALYLEAHPGSAPLQVRNAIVNNATSGKLKAIGSGSPNLLLYSLLP